MQLPIMANFVRQTPTGVAILALTFVRPFAVNGCTLIVATAVARRIRRPQWLDVSPFVLNHAFLLHLYFRNPPRPPAWKRVEAQELQVNYPTMIN